MRLTKNTILKKDFFFFGRLHIFVDHVYTDLIYFSVVLLPAACNGFVKKPEAY